MYALGHLLSTDDSNTSLDGLYFILLVDPI
jgi:hypothetical protein